MRFNLLLTRLAVTLLPVSVKGGLYILYVICILNSNNKCVCMFVCYVQKTYKCLLYSIIYTENLVQDLSEIMERWCYYTQLLPLFICVYIEIDFYIYFVKYVRQD